MIFNMLNFFYFTLLVSSINFVFIKSDNGLLFDVKENSLVQVEASIWSSKTETLCYYCASACPALSSAEIQYSNGESVGKKELIVQKIYERSANMNQINLPQCEGIIQTSYLYNKTSGLVEIGYEIHDENNKMESLQIESNKDDFFSLDPSNFTKTPIPKPEFLKYIESNKCKSTNSQQLHKFIWIPVLLIDLDVRTMSPKQIQYKPDLGSHVFRSDCSQFEVAEEFYDENIHQSSYSEANQRLLFTGDRRQLIPVPKGESACGQKYGCLVQHQIIPAYYMHSYNGTFALCTRMNTVPVWDSIVERLNIVNKYLYAMSQIWTSQIHITTGFSGVLKPSKKYFKKIPTSEWELYLDQGNRNIPVPMIIYKIVEYKMKIPSYEDVIDYKYAVIVIHNDPTPDADKERICDKKSTIKGWEDIENNKLPSGLTYVCPFNQDVASKLKLVRDENAKYGNNLEPNFFLFYNATKKYYVSQDKRTEIKQKIDELF